MVANSPLTPEQLDEIEVAINAAIPAPTTATELQAIVDAVEESSAIDAIVTASTADPNTLTETILTDGGVTVASSPLSEAQLDEIAAEIAAASPVPTTVVEIQAIVDANEANANNVAVVVASSGGGTLTEAELTNAGVVVANSPLTPEQLDEIEIAINAASPVPTTATELQALVDDTTLSSNSVELVNVSISPNPASSKITLRGLNTENPDVTIFNILGAKVMTSNANTINVSNLKSGIYILSIKTELGSVAKRFVKN